MKECYNCRINKEIVYFSKSSISKDGLSNWCKLCHREYRELKRSNPKTLIFQIYSGQINSSQRRGHGEPDYSREELYDWVLEQPHFKSLLNNWINSNFNSDLTPSIDRLKDYLPYTLNNIQLITWKENREKLNLDKIEGRNNKQSKAVLRLDIDTEEELEEYFSIAEAGRRSNISSTTISNACINNLIRGGYKWKFKI